jgi:xanthine phosphoribosyltransferase
MKLLKDRIVAEGRVIGDSILKVDSFLNHQVDPEFIMELGREIARRYAAEGITRILTVEASGIAVAMAAGLILRVPLVFAKKKKAFTQDAGFYSSEIFSFTRGEAVGIFVSDKYLSSSDTVLIVDDFLAHGEAMRGLVDIVRQAGAKLAGAAIVIEKIFQKGGQTLRSEGVRIDSLAAIAKMGKDGIVFAE